MESRSLAREVALLVLGQISKEKVEKYDFSSVEKMLDLGLDTLINHWRDQLDECANKIELAQEDLIKLDCDNSDKHYVIHARQYLVEALEKSQNILNVLSDTFELSRLLTMSDQDNIRCDALKRINFVIQQYNDINIGLDNVMEGWRLKRLPHIDQDILRLAYVDLYCLNTPTAVTCNEAVNLAHRYSDEQGRKMINGILRRLQN